MDLGKWGEDTAVEFLKKRGYRVIERNYRTSFGEIDIIAIHRGVIVFIEVKTRRTGEYGEPFEAIDKRKIEKIRRCALMYIKTLKKEYTARFDVVSIVVNKGAFDVNIIENAFES